MLACEENKHAESWMQRENKESRTIVAAASANPIDVAIAQAILQHNPQSSIALQQHESAPALDKDVLKAVQDFVDAHIALAAFDSLSESLASGTTLPFETTESIELPVLDAAHP